MAFSAFDADFLLYMMSFFSASVNGIGWAFYSAYCTAGAFMRINGVCQQWFAHFRRTFFIVNMNFKFMPEILERCKNGIWSCLA